jgi:hypothetical protein
MYKDYFYFLFWCIVVSCLASCASSGSLDGGPVDKSPPTMDKEKSSQNLVTNVTARSFVFYFDEFVEVRDAVKQILVSPPLTYIPAAKGRGKAVVFSFNEKEELKANTTYTINFGESIKDFNEGNSLKDFKYIFSTGPIIDSFFIEGYVMDNATNKGAEGITVMLYEDLSDSVIIKKKPYYFSKTDKDGKYTITNIKDSKFKLVAIKDENTSYTYNESTETIAFDTTVVVWSDTSSRVVRDLTLSKPELNPKVVGTSKNTYGVYGYKMNAPVKDIPKYAINPEPSYHAIEVKEDSLYIWYHNDNKMDSFTVTLPFEKTLVKPVNAPKSFRKMIGQISANTQNFSSIDSLNVLWNNPLQSIEESKMIFKDSFSQVAAKVTKLGVRKLKIVPSKKLLGKKNYTFMVLPAAVKDIYGGNNIDTLKINLSTFDEENFSEIALDLKGLDSTQQYIIDLVNNNQVRNSQILGNVSKKKLVYNTLKPEEYELVITHDVNKNGVKDEAHYWLKRQAEKSRKFKLERLRDAWLLEANIDYNAEAKENTVAPVAPQGSPYNSKQK